MDLFGSIKNKIEDVLPDQVENLIKSQGKDEIIKFIMDKVQPGKHEEAKKAVEDTLKKNDNGKLDANGIQGFIKQISSLVKPEYIDEVKKLAMGFLNKGK